MESRVLKTQIEKKKLQKVEKIIRVEYDFFSCQVIYFQLTKKGECENFVHYFSDSFAYYRGAIFRCILPGGATMVFPSWARKKMQKQNKVKPWPEKNLSPSWFMPCQTPPPISPPQRNNVYLKFLWQFRPPRSPFRAQLGPDLGRNGEGMLEPWEDFCPILQVS